MADHVRIAAAAIVMSVLLAACSNVLASGVDSSETTDLQVASDDEPSPTTAPVGIGQPDDDGRATEDHRPDDDDVNPTDDDHYHDDNNHHDNDHHDGS